MKIYLDLVLILNFVFDFLLLMVVSILLRRNVKIEKIIYGAFLGGLSILFLFFPLTTFQLFLFKIAISILMTLITFGYRDIRYTLRNLFYLYTASMLLGGFLYYLNVEFSYKQEGIVFYHHGLSINVILLIIFSPIILYTYVRQGIRLKQTYSSYYQVNVYFKQDQMVQCSAFLDTGNHLVDPYLKRPVILIDRKKLIYDLNEFQMVLVPYDTANFHGLLQCILIEKIWIQGIGERKNLLLGILDEKIHMDGIDLILHPNLLEG